MYLYVGLGLCTHVFISLWSKLMSVGEASPDFHCFQLDLRIFLGVQFLVINTGTDVSVKHAAPNNTS